MILLNIFRNQHTWTKIVDNLKIYSPGDLIFLKKYFSQGSADADFLTYISFLFVSSD